MLPMIKHHCFTLDSCSMIQDFSEETLLMNPDMNSTVEVLQQEEKHLSSKVGRRRSIGDLVERYKKIVEKNNATTSQNKISVPEDTVLD